MPTPPRRPLKVRPYRLLCAICEIGRGSRSSQLLRAIRAWPDRPVQLVCNAGCVYAWQDPGTGDDSPEGPEFNRKRDLDILQRLDLAPGCTLPARTLLHRVLDTIPTVAGICTYDQVTGPAWRGCSRATDGDYERAHALGIAGLVPPRDTEERAREKARSLAALEQADEVTVRPHLLMCCVCQYGAGVRPPLDADNLPELLQIVLSGGRSVRIRLAPGADWMMCAPCPYRVPELNACVNVAGSGGLSNEKRDLDLLQKLGLRYGDSMPAREIFLLLLERVPSTAPICARSNPRPSVWWDPCGERDCDNPRGNKHYRSGRRALLRRLRRLAG